MRIVYFDGVCNLCNGFVDTLMRWDHGHKLKFASLQGETAAAQLPVEYRESMNSIVFVDEGRILTESAAVLAIAGHLGWPFYWLRLGWCLPRGLRDAIYRFVARHRYQWFGRRETCRLPTPEERPRLLP